MQKLTIFFTQITYKMSLQINLSDGSTLRLMSSRDIARLPIWSGNRIIDETHRDMIHHQIGSNIKSLDLKPYHIVTYNKHTEEGSQIVSEIVDGQHRASILKGYYSTRPTTVASNNPFDSEDTASIITEDFPVMVIEKQCQSEQEIAVYFNILNHTKAIEWREDPRSASNPFIMALLDRFNTSKKKLIREGKTRSPYVSLDTLREEAIKRRIWTGAEKPDEYAERIFNEHQLGLLELQDNPENSPTQEMMVKAGCVLLIGKDWDWLNPIDITMR